MNPRATWILAALASLLAAQATAQSRGEGWEASAQLIYQDSQDIGFNGGSSVSLDDDIGLAISFAYRFNERLEVEFGIDWTRLDYDVSVVSASVPGLEFTGRGDLEAFTPHVGANFNLMQGPLTPYVNAGVGWSFIDTNIPNAPPQNVCWWDPWFGQVCGTFQSTRTIDEFTYHLGAGLRWDVSAAYTLRLGYEKRWLDLGEATSTPDFDQFRLGVTFRY